MKRWITAVSVSLMALFLCVGCNEESATLGLRVSGTEFEISNEKNESLLYRDGAFSGQMEVKGQQALGNETFLEVSDSSFFTYQCDGTGTQKFGIVTNADLDVDDPDYAEYTVSGSGLETMTIAREGKMSFSGGSMVFEAAFSIPCDSLGDSGFVRLCGEAQGKAEITADPKNSQIHFSGFTAGSSCWLSYAGAGVPHDIEDITLNTGSGTISLADLKAGKLIVSEDGCKPQEIEV